MPEQYQFVAKIIPDPEFKDENVKMFGSWFGMNNICVFPTKTKILHETPSNKTCNWNIIHLKHKTMLFDPKMRQLVNESSGVFQELQTNVDDPNKSTDALYYSRKYRAIISTCIMNIEKSNIEKTNDMYNQYKLLLHNLELIWHLCEVLYLVVVPGDTILNNLLDWIKIHYEKSENQALTIIEDKTAYFTDERVEDKFPYYWETVIGLILQGNIDLVRMLLCNHSQSNTEPFIHAMKILKSMPTYSVYGGLPIAEYTSRFKGWQFSAKNKLDSGMFLIDSNLNNIMKIVCGDPDCINLIHKSCSTWFEFFVAQLIYTEPTVKKHNLSLYAHRSIAKYYDKPEYNLMDSLTLNLFDGDLEAFVKKLKAYPDSGWSSTHLTNLLHLCDKIEPDFDVPEHKNNISPNEQYLLDYGTFLMSHHSLWQSGITYLDNCSSIGKEYISTLLLKLEILSDLRVSKILHYATARRLYNVVSSICKVKGMLSLQKSRIGEALCWAIRGQDSAFATHIANIFLNEYSKGGQFSCPDILENLGSIVLTCDRFMFLGKYLQFIKFIKNNSLIEAALLYIELLKSNICPKYFRLRLLLDVLLFIDDNNECYFNTLDMSLITMRLDDAIMEAEDDPKSADQYLLDQIPNIRSAIVKLVSISLKK
ncbi:nuclear pore complex protein Nup85 isoform X2 [Daktulosphaira vitifoliae]|uniref:nuclear pore complex protein Nup85 isoform X2 n=2 Tax=Daktulosphaira vitifoliae TaxID=58002 RepID=UPI0021AA1F45|nr:nuclear pore complex protein Nup85 isoform X2 [Daktulosphaira vitifoliae]